MTNRTTGTFRDLDFTDFWEDYSDPAEPAPSDELVSSIEEEIGFRLPDSYVEFARIRNGGIVRRCCYPTDQPNSWAEDHIQITTMYALGRDSEYSLLGELGHSLMQEELDYPQWGVGIADTPSAGHELIMLDYRECGAQCEKGEPSVVHVDQELDFAVTVIAPDFATFIKGLVTEEQFDEELDMEP